jgi:hypothetical protein
VKDLIKQGLAAIDPTLNWTTGNVGGVPTGLPIHYMTAKGNFDFDVNGAVEQIRGGLGCYIVEGPEKFVLVAFRFEYSSAEKNKLLDAIADSMTSFVPDTPAAAPAGPAAPADPAAPPGAGS